MQSSGNSSKERNCHSDLRKKEDKDIALLEQRGADQEADMPEPRRPRRDLLVSLGVLVAIICAVGSAVYTYAMTVVDVKHLMALHAPGNSHYRSLPLVANGTLSLTIGPGQPNVWSQAVRVTGFNPATHLVLTSVRFAQVPGVVVCRPVITWEALPNLELPEVHGFRVYLQQVQKNGLFEGQVSVDWVVVRIGSGTSQLSES